MKKFVSVLLAVSMIFASCAVVSSAADKEVEYPLVIVAGYSSSSLYCGDSPETGEMVWGVDFDLVLDRVLANLGTLLVGLGETLTIGDAKRIAKTVGAEARVILEKMRCNYDGTSVYDLKRVVSTAEEVNSANLMKKYPNGEYRHEKDMAVDFEKYVGNENIFNFTCDFRMGAEHCANQLDELIEDVKKYTGKDKVNIMSISHGGQVTATYLTLYGWKNDVDNAVLTVPAINGASLAYDALTNNVVFDEECLLKFIQHGERMEEDYDWLVKAQQLGFLDIIIKELVPELMPIIGYWGSMWDFVPSGKYEEAKKQVLDPVKSALLIEKSDRYHYEILPKMHEKLEECIDRGMNISIIAGSGNANVTGLRENSDGIITTNGSTGATCAPLGQRFADGYVQKNPCGGKNKVSPAMDIDASTAFLPDNTWFVNGLFHGMTYWDNYSRSLLMTLLFSDDITDVYSDKNYPQFKDSTNPSNSVYAQFKGCQPGEITDCTNILTVTNCCWENDVRLSAVYCDGIDLSFKINPFKKLAPGESVDIEFKGEIPEVSRKSVNVTVYYTMPTVTPVGYRTQAFKIENGEPVENIGGYVDIEADAPIDNVIGEGFDTILRTLGLKELVAMLTTIFYYWTSQIFAW